MNNSFDNISDVSSIIIQTILATRNLNRELRKEYKNGTKQGYLAIYVLFSLYKRQGASCYDLQKTLHAHYYDVQRALDCLLKQNLISIEVIKIKASNQKIVKSQKLYSLTGKGKSLINELIDRVYCSIL
ncbi:hypothetical protein NF867_00560 [Solitalea sp. MAHUQ-68]|uniref:Uncharacterized protein n=1 Tax=Solitalea agri TaxID=2953739 RepID=A0A9X2EZD8_9SPHI|nr:hypothetical protein [Solitalea agri]MCO4291351.1 hypothetical protein [Solitalea agri]